MTTPPHPCRRSFLRLLGLLCAAPAAVGPAAARPAPPFNPEGPEWLLQWIKLPRHPVTNSDHPATATMLRAIQAGAKLPLFYHGGSQPGRLRHFSPDLVFRPQGVPHLYVSGFCHLRQAPRTLRLDRISLA